MARWSDRKYYAGRITAERTGNKYVVHFEDGANKTLPSDHIVFGDKHVAPLLNQEVNVLVEANIYETGLVVAIDPNACTYNVMTDTQTVTVPATDLYLDEEQARAVQLMSAGAGEDGGGGKKKGPEASTSALNNSSDTATSGSGIGSRRKRKDQSSDGTLNTSAEAGPSTQGEGSTAPATKKSRKR